MEDEKKKPENELEPRTYVLPPGYYPEWDEGDEISLLSYINVLLRRRWLILSICVVAVVAAYVFSRMQSPVYNANASFLVAEDKSTQVMTDSDGYLVSIKNPVDYFKKIAVSQKILDEMLKVEFRHPETGQPERLAEIWQIEEESPQERLYEARDILKDRISLSNERNFPDLITLEVAASSSRLAADMANQLIVLLQNYDLDLKTDNIQRRLDIIEPQLKATEAKVESAETALENYLKRNRRDSPGVEIEKGRLEQQIELHRGIYNELRKQMELTQIAKVEKGSSAISVIDRAVPPRSPSSPRTRLNVALAGVVGLMLAVGLAFVLEFLFNLSEDTEESREFRRTLNEIKSDFKKIFLLQRGKPSRSEAARKSVEYRQAHK